MAFFRKSKIIDYQRIELEKLEKPAKAVKRRF